VPFRQPLIRVGGLDDGHFVEAAAGDLHSNRHPLVAEANRDGEDRVANRAPVVGADALGEFVET
jgi:hypothetical protein